MTTATTSNTAPSPSSAGFDGAVTRREDDHLNRWPFAREINGIATTGPNDWSVRVGVYGEWGSGKTSVLKFTASMAEPAGHIVIWFDPWQHSTKAELWRAFVLTVFHELESKLGQVPGADQARRKVWMEKAKGVVGAVTGMVNDSAGKAVDAGLELVKKHFAFSRDDLKSLQSILGEKRVIVLIDDLDRTAPELVPEILFALKELMDIPGFSFICAFDPMVVGQVLGRFHPGFGNGLKFLDKIIDYPRWLPPATPEELTKLALADSERFCDYVPEFAVRAAIPLLPANPRAVRQFIRLIALLKAQIGRHHRYELNWPVIMAANVLKIRHPRIAHPLLNTRSFWEQIETIGMGIDDDKGAKAIADAISRHVTAVDKQIGYEPTPAELVEITAIMTELCTKVDLFSPWHGETAAYQMNIAEAPAAVTWKEFDSFFADWDKNQTTTAATEWIKHHARVGGRTESEVYSELLAATIRRYPQALHKADDILVAIDQSAIIKNSETLLRLLEILILEMGELNSNAKWIADTELNAFVGTSISIIRSQLPVHRQFKARTENLLIQLIQLWTPDVLPMVKAVRPYRGWDELSGPFAASSGLVELHQKCRKALFPQFARQIMSQLREASFVENQYSEKSSELHETRRFIWDKSGPLWSQFRSEMFQLLSESSTNPIIQSNAYELLHWFVLLWDGEAPGRKQEMQDLLCDQHIFDAIWNAATARPLGDRAIYQLRKLPKMLEQFGGAKFSPPQWWTEAVARFATSESVKTEVDQDGGSDHEPLPGECETPQ